MLALLFSAYNLLLPSCLRDSGTEVDFEDTPISDSDRERVAKAWGVPVQEGRTWREVSNRCEAEYRRMGRNGEEKV